VRQKARSNGFFSTQMLAMHSLTFCRCEWFCFCVQLLPVPFRPHEGRRHGADGAQEIHEDPVVGNNGRIMGKVGRILGTHMLRIMG
jgi:hypothetical protein